MEILSRITSRINICLVFTSQMFEVVKNAENDMSILEQT